MSVLGVGLREQNSHQRAESKRTLSSDHRSDHSAVTGGASVEAYVTDSENLAAEVSVALKKAISER